MLAQLYKFLVALWNEEKKGTRFKDVRLFPEPLVVFTLLGGKLKRNARSLIRLYYIFITTNATEELSLPRPSREPHDVQVQIIVRDVDVIITQLI